LSCATPGASIYYTTDGSLPTTSSTLYTGAITISKTECLNFKAVKSGLLDSSAACAMYNILSANNFVQGSNTWTPDGSTWSVSGGQYCQSDATTSHYSTMTGKRWTNATYDFDVKIVNNGGNNSDWAGLSIDRTNPTDYFSTSGYVIFIRANGQICLYDPDEILQSASTGLNWSTYRHIRVVTSGQNIQVFVDGSTTALLNVNDSTYTGAGGYASVDTCNTSSNFENVEVQCPISPPSFCDDFTVSDGNWTPNSGTWSIVSGVYDQSEESTSHFSSVLGTLPNKTWADATYDFDVKIVNNGGNNSDWAGINIRRTNSSDAFSTSGYTIYIRANGQICLGDPGGVLQTASTGLDWSTFRHIKVVTEGQNIKVYVNGSSNTTLNVEDTTYTGGYASLVTCNTHSDFDNVVIQY
jgi:archaellum component FlaG (FlaF/FlaG flagellin family)